MNDPVIRALREIVPVTRGQVYLGGRMLRWVESGTGSPTVVLVAGRNDTALAAGRGATHIIADGSGHAVPLDRPALVAKAILGFLQ